MTTAPSFQDLVARELARRSPELTHTPEPPNAEPPAVKLTERPRVHHVVAWYWSGRLSKEPFPDRSAAMDELERLACAHKVVYLVMVMDGQRMVVRREVQS